MKNSVLIIYLGHHGLDPKGIMAGAQGATVQHAEFLAHNGFDVIVMSPLTCPNLKYHGVNYINVTDWLSVVKFLKILKKCWDVIFSVGSPSLLRESYCIPYLQFARLRILSIHSGLSGVVDFGRVKIINRYTNIVICVSNSIKQMFVNYGVKKEKLRVVYNGIDKNIFHPCNVKRNMKRIIFVGAPIPMKGIDTLLIAFNKVKTKIPDVELVICGSAKLHFCPEYKFDKSLIPPDNSVLFRGTVPQKELAEEFSGSALAVFPSSKKYCLEGFAKVSIEAQACGCPVIVSNNGGLPETLVDGVTGKVFPSDNSDELASTTIKLLSSPEKLRNMSIQAEKHIKQNFLLNQVFQPLKTIVEQGMKNKGFSHYLNCISKMIKLTLEKRNIGYIRYYIKN